MPSSPTTSDTHGRPAASGDSLRQKPGAACVRCRSKKLKCDGRRPRCGACIRSDADCEPAAAQVQRGPKKGYLLALQNKIGNNKKGDQSGYRPSAYTMPATLEQQLAATQGAAPPKSVAPPPTPSPMHTPQLELDFLSMDTAFLEVPDDLFLIPNLASATDELPLDPPPSPVQTGMALTPPHTAGPMSVGAMSVGPVSVSSMSTGPMSTGPLHLASPCPEDSSGLAEAMNLPPAVPEPLVLTSLLQSDLNQVYFERTHRSVPILHWRQYFSWAQSPSKTPAQKCLQHAMWTSAASLSSHLQPLQESLYRATQRLLDASSDAPNAATSIEYVQARILMSIYDFVHRNHRQGWISAGQCFRMVQLMGLHQLDDPLRPKEPNDLNYWVQLEEKRRAFWMAYCIDVLVSKGGQLPLTLHQHVRGTRLPLPEDAFQNDEPHETQYLYEILEAPAQPGRGPFIELITLCTISRNIASLKRNHLDGIDGLDGMVPTSDLRSHHSRLSSTLDLRTEALVSSHTASLLRSDPILLFTRMFAHALALCLCSDLKKVLPENAEDYDELTIAWQHRALKAVFGIVGLARSIASLSYFKMHPFTPLPLGICRDFLDSGQWVDQSTKAHIQELSHLLHDMGSVNNLAQEYLDECASRTLQLS